MSTDASLPISAGKSIIEGIWGCKCKLSRMRRADAGGAAPPGCGVPFRVRHRPGCQNSAQGHRPVQRHPFAATDHLAAGPQAFRGSPRIACRCGSTSFRRFPVSGFPVSGGSFRCRARGSLRRHTLRQTYFISRYSSIPYFDPSRPRPDCLTPPKGASAVEIRPVFTPTMPYSSSSMTFQMRRRSLE